MSEHQYYEFRAIDRPLTQEEQGELRDISTRATITASSFTNTYQWGDLKADPARLVERYFDAHYYMANWPTRILIFRFPASLVPLEALELYATGNAVVVWSHGEHTLVQIFCHHDDYANAWWEDEGALGDLQPLRDQILEGDMRCLYLAWLDAAYPGEIPDDNPAPPVPAGLGQLSGALERLIDVFMFDRDLIAAATAHSSALDPADDEAEARALASFIAELPEADKDALLMRVARRDRAVSTELMAQFRQHRRDEDPERGASAPSVSLEDFLEEAESIAERRMQEEARVAARRAEERAREEAERRAWRFQRLVDDWEGYWRAVDEAIQRRHRMGYRDASTLMAELKEAAETHERVEDYRARVFQIREECSTWPALMEEMNKAGLPGATG